MTRKDYACRLYNELSNLVDLAQSEHCPTLSPALAALKEARELGFNAGQTPWWKTSDLPRVPRAIDSLILEIRLLVHWLQSRERHTERWTQAISTATAVIGEVVALPASVETGGIRESKVQKAEKSADSLIEPLVKRIAELERRSSRLESFALLSIFIAVVLCATIR